MTLSRLPTVEAWKTLFGLDERKKEDRVQLYELTEALASYGQMLLQHHLGAPPDADAAPTTSAGNSRLELALIYFGSCRHVLHPNADEAKKHLAVLRAALQPAHAEAPPTPALTRWQVVVDVDSGESWLADVACVKPSQKAFSRHVYLASDVDAELIHMFKEGWRSAENVHGAPLVAEFACCSPASESQSDGHAPERLSSSLRLLAAELRENVTALVDGGDPDEPDEPFLLALSNHVRDVRGIADTLDAIAEKKAED